MRSRPTAIEALAADPANSGLILDFDGVLSPIVPDPTTSLLPDEVAAVLTSLAKRFGLLAVISGRPVEFLQDRVRVPGIKLLGSYGAEQVFDGVRKVDPDTQEWISKVREAGEILERRFDGYQGVRVEKKAVSVAVHWRQAPDHEQAAAEVRRATRSVAANTGLLLEPGKLVEELRPPTKMNKGRAISLLLSAVRPSAVAYAGDDLGDIPALEEVRQAGGYALVVDHGTETDPKVLGLADEEFSGTEGFSKWLFRLARAVEA
jgi:trehalose 6-phosphate phosphatase